MPEVTLLDVNRTLLVEDGTTLLSAALDAGIDYPHGCKSGRCGRCKSRLLEGEVDLLDHSRFALSAEDRDAGLILACRALPTTDARVTWNLETVPMIRRREADLAGS